MAAETNNSQLGLTQWKQPLASRAGFGQRLAVCRPRDA